MEEPRRLGGRYELGGVLGRGGMAEVYLAHDTRLGRSVAVKTLRADMARDPSFQARFRREAQSAASLNHPAIVAVYDTGEDYIDGISIPYIVMEYVEGSTLRELLHSGRRLLPERALEMTIGILQALEYSHRAGIVHRDIKPANVMLTRQGNVKVMDFGIARAMGDAGMTMTQTSAVIGTAQYLSPEQAKGEQVDARSDLYSTGCLLYELLTVRPPFVGDSPVAVAYQHVREEPQPPSVFDPEVRPEIDAIVLKALAKDRDYRYQSADEMRDDIERFLDGLPVAAAQQAAAYGMGAAGYGYDQNGYPQQHDPYGQTNVLPQQPGGGPTTVLPQAGGQPGYGPQGGYQDDGYGQTYAGGPSGGGPDDGYGREGGRRGEEPPKKSNTSWIVLAVAAVLVLVGTFFVAQAMFNGNGAKDTPKVSVPNLVGKSLADAKTAAAAAGPKLVVTEGDKIACPDANIKKDQVCTQNPVVGGQVAENATITVQISSGPAKTPVPSVIGKTKDQATKAFNDAGFTNVTTEYKDDDTAPQETVTAQDPASGSADPGAPVKLTVSQGKAKLPVPNVVGMQKEVAQAQLEGQGFQVDASKTAQTNDPTKVNTVAQQSVPAGTKAPANTKITLTVYKAQDKPQVPALQNVKLSDAISQLTKAGLGFTVVSGPSDPNATVMNTNPPAGTQLDPNTQVQLVTKPADPPKGGDPLPPVPPTPSNTKGGNN
ncbi:beta-lactam-binding protein with PASTA domain/tRNA A-37 threonylcarbamoyl transferase component Bud32 [Kitasatospora sp. MAA19]|uniref:Stk1 family PASTA domain-containing Ser/Thr kinase n=1 Tax=unclassified Kitasatospora TaxID=2633591 RepID=UPI0024730BEB|nr:Stk1 family PASTA domain-containing Ser/Thr kinase [Kitasatospora sp. MAA19]MDH6703694.1 beta-lactam-binding protein with PASTA domain/tRNA A-37 threonylcarbamoyl transferase component Bud32 [Kitasatospora sp. MAA19]